MKIYKIFTEYQECPLGLDESVPRFSWELISLKHGAKQEAYQITVVREDGETVWKTGQIWSNRSIGIAYEGEQLEACTRYEITVKIWDCFGKTDQKTSWFETGWMDTSEKPWDGAQWIAAPRYTVSAETRGVFTISSTFRMSKDAIRAGIVFGEGDYRLSDASLNEYGIAGENYIRYEIDRSEKENPMLKIYRVGYAKQDTEERPFASIELKAYDTGENILTEQNQEEFHTLKIQVNGNTAIAYVDDRMVDPGECMGGEYIGRVLNPRGINDVLTYPRLHKIGFFAGDTGRVYFKNYTVSNIRTPGRIFIDERPGESLYGKPSIFEGKIETEKQCFVLKGRQVTADPSNTSLPMFRRNFQIRSKVKKIRLYMTARGIYDVQINGKNITNSLLAPGLTQYDKRIHYQTYALENMIQEGENSIGVVLASGWWSDAQTFTVKNYNYFGDKEAFLCKLVICYEDGEQETLVSDTKQWKYYGEGPYIYAGYFLGEQYDSRREWIYQNFAKSDFDASEWEEPVEYHPAYIPAYNAGFARDWPEVNKEEPQLIGGYDAPVYVVEERTAKECQKQKETIYIYDMGQEMAGVPELVFHEKEGTRIRIRYAEMLYPDLPKYGDNAGKLMRENYRDAESTDLYICRGDAEGEVYRPRFTFHGFRYIELHGVTNPPELKDVKALQYSSIVDFQGSFDSSHPLLNRFVENVKWSQRCNFINIPTDCPQRNERMGWAGDTHVFCNTAIHNSNLKLFYERNLEAMADLQEENGRYPEIAPIGCGFGGITYECASIFMAWELYLQYADQRILQKFYPGMKRYMSYMKDKGLPGKGKEEYIGPLADWLAFEETDPQLMWNAFYYRESVLMEKIARVLGFEQDQKEYHQLAKKIKNYWNKTFVDASGEYTLTLEGMICDTQCSYALPLVYGVVENTEKLAARLSQKVRENDYKVGTGFFGTGLLNRALSDSGYQEEAYRLLLQTEFPSWLYPVTQGATTIWEHWDSYTKENGFGEYNTMNSFNHYSLGSVLLWMYEEILGIKRLEEFPGYTHFLLQPVIGDELEYAGGSVASPFGTIWSHWEKMGDKVRYTCTIPPNTSATLHLPDNSWQELEAGSYEFYSVYENKKES